MLFWRNLSIAIVAVIAAGPGQAQTYSLVESPRVGDCFRVHIDMALSGELRVNRDGKQVPLKLEALATHDFPERLLNVGADGLADKAARYYETAKATVTLDKDVSERFLRTERRLMVAERSNGRFLLYCPAGTLTRDELDLTGDHFDTLALTGLLPGKAVAVGESWKLPNSVVQALCSFEGLTEQNIECKLEEVQNEAARFSVKGTSSGIDLGAQVKLIVDAICVFDLQSHKITRIDWKQKDDREQGPVSPASSLHTTVRLNRNAVEQPSVLSDVALVSVPDGFGPPEPLTQLEYRDQKNGFAMQYNREWQTVSQSDEHVVLRLLDRGEFVSQVTLTPWTKAEEGKHLTPEEFRQAMSDTPGWQPEEEVQAGEVPGDKDRYIYRISSVGQLEGSKVMQNFYLVAAPDGRQLVLVFTLAPKQVDRLGTKDLMLAAGTHFVHSKDASPQK
jgi:hypothetical protein